MTEPTVKDFLKQAGYKGGSARSAAKAISSRANAIKAREAKLLKRLTTDNKGVNYVKYK